METTSKKTSEKYVNEITKNNYSTDEKELLKKNPENKQLIESIPIQETPFTAIKHEDKWYLCLGKYRLTPEGKDTLEEIEKESKNASWYRLMQFIQIMLDENETTQAIEQRLTKIENQLNINI